MSRLPVIIERCLALGVVVYPYQLYSVLTEYERYRLPNAYLNKLDKADLQKYVKGLYLSNQEAAYDWTRGHELLKELGFERKERTEGHRTFVSMVYIGLDKENTYDK